MRPAPTVRLTADPLEALALIADLTKTSGSALLLTIHDLSSYALKLSTGGVIPTPAGTGGDDSHAEASAIGPGIAQNPSDPTNTEHRV